MLHFFPGMWISATPNSLHSISHSTMRLHKDRLVLKDEFSLMPATAHGPQGCPQKSGKEKKSYQMWPKLLRRQMTNGYKWIKHGNMHWHQKVGWNKNIYRTSLEAYKTYQLDYNFACTHTQAHPKRKHVGFSEEKTKPTFWWFIIIFSTETQVSNKLF